MKITFPLFRNGIAAVSQQSQVQPKSFVALLMRSLFRVNNSTTQREQQSPNVFIPRATFSQSAKPAVHENFIAAAFGQQPESRTLQRSVVLNGRQNIQEQLEKNPGQKLTRAKGLITMNDLPNMPKVYFNPKTQICD